MGPRLELRREVTALSDNISCFHTLVTGAFNFKDRLVENAAGYRSVGPAIRLLL